jgi:hypothetical protein
MALVEADAVSSFDDIFVGLERISMKRSAAPTKTIKKTKPVAEIVVNPDDDDAFPKKKKIPSPFTNHLPPERTWPVAPIGEKSVSFTTWMQECQGIVDQHFGAKVYTLAVKAIKDFLWITLQSKNETRVFAFVSKSTGNIHCPALFDEPFTTSHGHILDPITRLAVMCAWGVQTPWSWLPTYPANKRYSKYR